jgi:hypothetical protein
MASVLSYIVIIVVVVVIVQYSCVIASLTVLTYCSTKVMVYCVLF